jgi:hypothetical protein
MSGAVNFELRGRITARALAAGADGVLADDLRRELGFGARTTVGWMLAEGQLELVEPGRVRLAPMKCTALDGRKFTARLALGKDEPK